MDSTLNDMIMEFMLFFFFFCSPQISVKLLVHKIQSPQEWEALQALTVCVDLIFLLFYSTIMYCTKVQKMDSCKLSVFVGSRGLHEELREKISQ